MTTHDLNSETRNSVYKEHSVEKERYARKTYKSGSRVLIYAENDRTNHINVRCEIRAGNKVEM